MPTNDLASIGRNAFVALSHKADPLIRRVVGDDDLDPTRRLAHWAASMGSAYSATGLVRLGVPWWTYRSIEWVDAWMLGREKAPRVLEYGSGASTVWLAARSGSVDSIEHDAGFATVVEDLISESPNASLHLIEPVAASNPTTPSGRSEFAGLDFTDYVAAGPALGGTFDVVVIDGRARTACLDAIIDQVSPDGIVIFDNSRRDRYRSPIESCGLKERRFRGLAPTLPYPDQTSVLSHRG